MRRPSPATVVTLSAAVVCTVLRIVPIFDPDTFWHLHTGRVIAHTHAIPTVDTFSHTARGRPWHFVDWLSQLALWVLYRLDGYTAVIVATALIGGLSVSLCLRHTETFLSSLSPRSRALGLAAIAPLLIAGVIFRTTPRPQTLSFVFVALLPILLRHRRAAWATPVLIALWQNLHSSAPLGVALCLAATAGTFIDRKHIDFSKNPSPTALFAITLLSILSLFATVHPFDRLTAGMGHLSDPELASLITEWSPTLHFGLGAPPSVVLIALCALGLAGALQRQPENRPDTATIFIAAGLTLMAFRAVRFVPLAAIALCPVAAVGVSRVFGHPRFTFCLVALTIGLGAFPTIKLSRPLGFGVMTQRFPVGAAGFIASTRPRGKLFNDFLFGGYLMFALDDRWPVFIDGRSWAVYDPSLVRAALTATPATLSRLIERYDLGLAVVHTDARITWFHDRPGWSVVYLDDTAFVAVRDDLDRGYVSRWAYREVHPSRWAEQIPLWRRNPESLSRALAETRRMVHEAPRAALAWVLRSAALTAQGDVDSALRAAQRAVAIYPDGIPGHRAVMVTAIARGDRATVCREARYVLLRSPRNHSAREAHARFGCH